MNGVPVIIYIYASISRELPVAWVSFILWHGCSLYFSSKQYWPHTNLIMYTCERCWNSIMNYTN